MSQHRFFEDAASLTPAEALLRLIRRIAPRPSALDYYGGFDGLPDELPEGPLYLGVDQSLIRLRRELAEMQALSDAAAEQELTRRRTRQQGFQRHEAERLQQRLAIVGELLELIIAWRPQFDAPQSHQRAEILRAHLIVELVGLKAWAQSSHDEAQDPALPATGADYRDARVQDLQRQITQTEAEAAMLHDSYRVELPMLLDLRRLLTKATLPAA